MLKIAGELVASLLGIPDGFVPVKMTAILSEHQQGLGELEPVKMTAALSEHHQDLGVLEPKTVDVYLFAYLGLGVL